MKCSRILLYILIAAGIVLRCFSVSWNVIPHGDIGLDAAAANAIRTQGNFRLSDNTSLPPADQYLIQHPPVWALLGAATMHITKINDAYAALKIASLLSGIGVLWMTYRVACKFLVHEEFALMITSLLSVSWLMIDFSGNGSLYSLHALLFLIWLDVAIRDVPYKGLWLGLMTGISYLVNYQAIILIPASLLLLLLERRLLSDFIAYSAAAIAIASPWLIRNHILFGEALFGHTINSTYLYLKTGIESADYTYTTAEKLAVLKQILTRWLPFNLYFAARKLFILAPVAFVAFAYAWDQYLFSWRLVQKHMALLLLLLGHLAISSAWPVMKFRYFVPLLPLVLLVAAFYMLQTSWSIKAKSNVMYAALICQLGFSAVTYAQIPTHTYYYDGAITEDAFHDEGEINFMQDQGIL